MNVLGAAILLSISWVILAAQRRTALMGVMAAVLYLTQSQQLNVFGINMYALRFVEIAAFFRVIKRREFSFAHLNAIDKLVIAVYTYTTLIFLLRSNESLAYQIGIAVDSLLCYFAFRGFVRDLEDFRWFLRSFVYLLAPFVVLVLIESFTNETPFSVLGKVALGEDWFRGGRLRCEGSFRHPSLLGTLGASFLIIYAGLWFSRPDRKRATYGIILCLLIVWASNSGAPLNFTGIGIVGWGFWILRTRMKLVRRCLVLAIFLLYLSMKAPIWYLLAKVSTLSGGDGWHRSFLMDMAFQNLGKWWLAGMSIKETTDWFPYNLEATGGADMTNTFLGFGITGGLGALVLFVWLLVVAFKQLGRALALLRQTEWTKETEYILWGLGVTLVGHIVNWFGIIYFDQTYVIWFFQLAVISVLTQRCIETAQIGDSRGDFLQEAIPTTERGTASGLAD